MRAHMCNFLKIHPLATLEHETYHHKRSKCAPKGKTVKNAPTSQPNPKLKCKHSACDNTNKK